MKTKVVDITPDTSLLPKLGYSGYSLSQALSEFIDNAIDAGIESGKVNVRIKISSKRIVIYDNGPGMTTDELVKAMTLAHSEKTSAIGRFGMGLKTAALSLGSKFKITTISKTDQTWNTVAFDEDQWNKDHKREWSIKIKSRMAENTSQAFTRIAIQKLKISSFKSLTKLRSDISLMYAPYIKSGMLSIWINNKKCLLPRPVVLKGSKKKFSIPMKEHSTLLTQFDINHVVSGLYALTRDAQKGKYYGFNLYWHGRLITEYSKIGIGDSIANSRIIGEIQLDFLPVTHNKREFLVESDEYKIVEKILSQFFAPLREAAEMLSQEATIQKALTSETSTWLGTLARAFIKSQDLKELTMLSKLGVDTGTASEKGDDNIDKTENIIMPEKPPVKKDSNDNPEDNLTKKPENGKRQEKKARTKKKPRNRLKLNIKGKKFEFTHKFVSLGVRGPWKKHQTNEELGIVEIFTNTDFPAFKATEDKSFYAVMNIVDSLASVFIDTVGKSEYSSEEIRELILREACTLALEGK